MEEKERRTLNITMHPERVRVDYVTEYSSAQSIQDGVKILTFYSGIPLAQQDGESVHSATVVANIALSKSIAKRLAEDLIKFLKECGEDVGT